MGSWDFASSASSRAKQLFGAQKPHIESVKGLQDPDGLSTSPHSFGTV